MASVFISPSNETQNSYITKNGSEANFTRAIANAMQPYLLLNGISYRISDASDTIQKAIEKGNTYRPTLYIAIRSNTAPKDYEGRLKGPEVYYYKDSTQGELTATDIGESLSSIYPFGEVAEVISVKNEIREIVKTKSTAVYIVVGYHDNRKDAEWIEKNVDSIAKAIVMGICESLKIPFKTEGTMGLGFVRIREGNLNVRNRPTTDASVIGTLSDNEPVLVIRTLPKWYFVLGDEIGGYVSKDYIEIIQSFSKTSEK